MPDEQQSPVPPRTAFWPDLAAEDKADLAELGRRRSHPAGTVVVHEGDQSDHVLVILRGWVKVARATDEGKTVFYAVRGPGDLICESAMFNDGERSATITTLDRLEVLVVLAKRFASFADSRPRVWRLVAREAVRRQHDSDRRVLAHAYADGPLRLINLLILLAELTLEYEPVRRGDEIVISAPLSQAELGSWVDASRETAARAFRTLRDRGLVRTGWRRITVLDLAGLKAYAQERRKEPGE